MKTLRKFIENSKSERKLAFDIRDIVTILKTLLHLSHASIYGR